MCGKENDIVDLDSVNSLVARGKNRRDLRKPKPSKVCDHCQKPGHEKDQCFKLIGYPNWYDDFKGKKKNTGSRLVANVTNHFDNQETPLGEDVSIRSGSVKPQFDSHFIQALAQEIAKFS